MQLDNCFLTSSRPKEVVADVLLVGLPSLKHETKDSVKTRFLKLISAWPECNDEPQFHTAPSNQQNIPVHPLCRNCQQFKQINQRTQVHAWTSNALEERTQYILFITSTKEGYENSVLLFYRQLSILPAKILKIDML
jgi:hypothetical protein